MKGDINGLVPPPGKFDIICGYNLCTFCISSDCHIAITSLDDGLHEIALKRFSVMLGLIHVLSLQVIQAVHRGQIQ